MLAVVGVEGVLAVGALLPFEWTLVAEERHRNNLNIIAEPVKHFI